MDTDLTQARQDALSFLKRHTSGVVATVSDSHGVHASTIYYVADDKFNIYFLTLINSRKYKAIESHPQVAVTISFPEVPQTLQIEGMATDISLDEEASKKRRELFDVLNSNNWFYGPITKLDPAEVVVVWVRPTWIRWADYAFAQSGSSNILREIPIE